MWFEHQTLTFLKKNIKKVGKVVKLGAFIMVLYNCWNSLYTKQ